MPQQNAQYITYAVTAAVILLIVALRWRRMSQSRPLRLERLAIMPAYLALITAVVMYQFRPSVSDLPWFVLATVIGGAIGWYRGKMMQIMVDPETHALNQKGSPAALLFLVAVIAVRFGLRAVLTDTLHVSVALITDASMVFVVAMFGVMRVEMFIRARRLLNEARAAKAAGTAAPAEVTRIVE